MHPAAAKVYYDAANTWIIYPISVVYKTAVKKRWRAALVEFDIGSSRGFVSAYNALKYNG